MKKNIAIVSLSTICIFLFFLSYIKAQEANKMAMMAKQYALEASKQSQLAEENSTKLASISAELGACKAK